MEKQLSEIQKTLWKNKKLFALIAASIFILAFATSLGGLGITNVFNPGPEGALVTGVGVNFKYPGTNGVTGMYTYTGGQSNSGKFTSAGGTTMAWGDNNGPTEIHILQSQSVSPWNANNLQKLVGTKVTQQNQLQSDIESNIQLESDWNILNSTPDTVGGNASNAVLVSYQHINSAKTNADGSVTYSVTDQNILLVQGNFQIDVQIPPAKTDANTASGWQEGTWANMELWYSLSWYQWINSLGGTVNSALSSDPLAPSTRNNSTYTFNSASGLIQGGGFPLSAWVQQITFPYSTSSGTGVNLFNLKTSTGLTATPQQLGLSGSTLTNLIASAQTTPGTVGQYIPLFTQPNDNYQMPTDQPTAAQITAYAQANVPNGQTQTPTQYFRLGITNFGTVAVSNGWYQGFTVYYPVVDYLIHTTYAVYGSHTYVWTTQTAQQQNYPGWTSPVTLKVITTGPLTGFAAWVAGLGNWFSNPLTQFWLLLIIAGVAIVILIVFFPELAKALSGAASRKINSGAAKKKSG